MTPNKTKQDDLEKTIIKNFELFKTQAAKIGNPKLGNLLSVIDENAERIMVAPASTRREYTCCHPGGLVEHSLRVLQNGAKLRQAYSLTEVISIPSLILVSLFHDIGKMGTQTKDYYVHNESDWHREKLGVYYNIQERFQHMPVSQMSLMLLNNAGVQLEMDEWYAISSIGAKNIQEDLPTQGAPWLSVVLSQAVKAACMQGKNKEGTIPVQ
jgi:hypothetical protein